MFIDPLHLRPLSTLVLLVGRSPSSTSPVPGYRGPKIRSVHRGGHPAPSSREGDENVDSRFLPSTVSVVGWNAKFDEVPEKVTEETGVAFEELQERVST